MGFFRAMGADSVAYHKKTIVDRLDDHPGAAFAYYGSRGETPLSWGGRLAGELGLTGNVPTPAYEAAYGPGGFRHPLTGEQLTRVKRPGFEIVIGPHKSVGILGVIGLADDMHAILDAETTATLTVLEDYWMTRGGSRGREQRRTATSGLAWVIARHGTTRAGDPHPHDHIMILNLVRMLDPKGGFKALDSAALRDLLEAATMVGRLHAAAKAIELGYQITFDEGTSGRARRWRIVGIPDEVCELFSKRADEIARYLEERGHSSYRARNIAARATRNVKRHTGVDELMPQWQAELEAIGWSVDRLTAHLDAARTHQRGLRPALTAEQIDTMIAELMDPDSGFHTRRKVFTRWQLIADTIDRLATQPGPTVDRAVLRRAITAKQDTIGRPLTSGQRAAIHNICGPTGAVKVVVGVAGSGKTTALDAATTALEDAGYQVIGTATSGQAARTLGAETGIDARTTHSLHYRLDHGQLTLTNRSVVILDEAGMTADGDLARILHGARRSGAMVVLVGDPRQLAPVGPGGALAAVLAAHPEIVTVMGDNVRQRDPHERGALAEIRHGDIDLALDWYARHDRIHTAPTLYPALHDMVEAFARDIDAGHDTLMLAWRRDTVAALNRFARVTAAERGWITRDDLTAPGGHAYAVGDSVVTLAPNYQGDLVTSQRAHITHVDHHRQALTIETDDGRHVTLAGEQIDAEHLAHGYALTVHRTQGATSDRTHYLAEGGGRELTYVALSRARHRTTIHTVADDLHQALDDLAHHWNQSQAQDWVTLTHQPGLDPATMPDVPAPALPGPEPAPVTPLNPRERIMADLDHLNQGAPPDVRRHLSADLAHLKKLRQDRTDLPRGSGIWRYEPEGAAARALTDAESALRNARYHVEHGGLRARPRHLLALRRAEHVLDAAQQRWDAVVAPVIERLDHDITTTENRIADNQERDIQRKRWLAAHPERAAYIDDLGRQLLRIDHPEQARMLDHLDHIRQQATTGLELGREPPDLGLSL